MASGFKVGSVDLDDIFAPRDGHTPVSNTGLKAGSQDLADRYRGTSGGDTIGYNTGFLVGGTDLRLIFRDKSYVPPVYASVDSMGVVGVQAPGNLITITCTASGDGPLTYVWRKGSVVISGATSHIYSFTAVGNSDDGIYQCTVTGPYNTSTGSVEIDILEEEDPEVTVSISGSSFAPIGSYGSAHSWTLTADATDGLARVRFGVTGHGAGAWLELVGAPTHYTVTTDWSDPFGSPSISHSPGLYFFYVDAQDIHGNTAHDSMAVTVGDDDP